MEERPEDIEKNNKAIVTERVLPNQIEPTELEMASLGHLEQDLLQILTDLLKIKETI